jgi:hypothetical protein
MRHFLWRASTAKQVFMFQVKTPSSFFIATLGTCSATRAFNVTGDIIIVLHFVAIFSKMTALAQPAMWKTVDVAPVVQCPPYVQLDKHTVELPNVRV